jgi:hypothetical protein
VMPMGRLRGVVVERVRLHSPAGHRWTGLT